MKPSTNPSCNEELGSGKMHALIFEMKFEKLLKAKLRGMCNVRGYWAPGGPVSLQVVPIPSLPMDDWVLIRTELAGICGSDLKELTLSGSIDNPLQSFVKFPQIMGHEVTGIVHSIGNKVKTLKPGDRVAISPWFSCVPRGIVQLCPNCQRGDFTHCLNFQHGNIPTGMHLGVTPGYGGFAEYVAVHSSQCFILPEPISFQQAVLADPFAVAFHSCLLLDPQPNQLILVYGLGAIGLLTVLCLKRIFKIHRVFAIGRYPYQAEFAKRLGAEQVFLSYGESLIEQIASYLKLELYTPTNGLKWSMDGVEGIIDTIASADTLEVGMRVLITQGRLVMSGVATPARCENTPHYFKELEIIGSNAFGMETFQNKRQHGIQWYLEFLTKGIVDTEGLITHNFLLQEYQNAFTFDSTKKLSKAVKIVFNFPKLD